LAIRNDKVEKIIKEQFTSMENSLNAVEEMLEDVPSNEARIGWHFGTIRENYRLVVDLLEIFPPKKEQ